MTPQSKYRVWSIETSRQTGYRSNSWLLTSNYLFGFFLCFFAPDSVRLPSVFGYLLLFVSVVVALSVRQFIFFFVPLADCISVFSDFLTFHVHIYLSLFLPSVYLSVHFSSICRQFASKWQFLQWLYSLFTFSVFVTVFVFLSFSSSYFHNLLWRCVCLIVFVPHFSLSDCVASPCLYVCHQGGGLRHMVI